MKHFFIGVIALVLCMGMASCKKETNEPKNEPAAQEQAAKAPSLADVVAKAKAEGANWSVDEWKAQMREFLLAFKPIAVAMESAMKRMESEPDKMQEILAEMKALQEQNPNLDSLLNEFTQIATSTANGKIVYDDEEWLENLKKELGVPEL